MVLVFKELAVKTGEGHGQLMTPSTHTVLFQREEQVMLSSENVFLNLSPFVI